MQEDEYSQELITEINHNFKLDFNSFILEINENFNFVYRKDEIKIIGPKILNLQDKNFTHIVVTKDTNENIILYLNAKKVFHILKNELVFFEKEFLLKKHENQKKEIIEGNLSLWVDTRINQFKIKESTSDDYEVTPVDEQILQLTKSIDSLEDLINEVSRGKTMHIDHILTTLRSLLFYNKSKSSYDPLLLRIASYKQMELPIYVNPSFILENNESSSFSISCPASMGRSDSNYKIIDFQEYLESNIIKSNNEQLTPLLFISKAANTMSSAHHDQRKPKSIAKFEKVTKINGVSTLDRVIVDLAILTVGIGEYILNYKNNT